MNELILKLHEKYKFQLNTSGTFYVAYILDKYDTLPKMSEVYKDAGKYFRKEPHCIERNIRHALSKTIINLQNQEALIRLKLELF